MTNLQTKSGEKLFTAYVEVTGVELAKVNGAVVAVLNGETLPGVVKKVEGHKISELVSAIDPASLVGKDPTTFTADELAAFTQYLQDVAAGKVKTAPAKAEKPAKKEKKEAAKAEEKPAKKGKKEAVKEEEKEEATLPEGVESVEDLEAMGAKALWKLAQPLGLEGVNSRSPKADLVKALAEYFDLEMEEEDEDEDIENDEIEDADDEEEEDSEESDDEDEDEDDESEEDDEDEEDDEEEDEEDDEDEDSDDEDDEDEDDEDEEEEDDELTAADIDAMETKEELIAVIKKHNIKLPSKKLTTRKVKEFIKETLFGDDE